MTIIAWIRMSAAERDAATLLDDDEARLGARLVDNPASTFAGLWVAPSRLLGDPLYQRWWPSLAALPQMSASTDDLFLPPPDA